MAVTADYAASDLPTLFFNIIGGILSGMSSGQNPYLLGGAIIIIVVLGSYFKVFDKLKGFVRGIMNW